MSSGTTGATEDCYFLRSVQQACEDVDLVVGRAYGGRWLGEAQSRCLLDGFSHGYIARDGNHGNTASRERSPHSDLEHTRHLLRLRDQLAVMAALREEMLRMGLLKISAAHFVAGDLSCNRKDGNAAAMTIVKAVD